MEYFRGIDFHLLVLGNEDKVLELMPSMTDDGTITQLKEVNDSIRLG